MLSKNKQLFSLLFFSFLCVSTCRNYVYYCVHLLCLFVYFKNVLALKTRIKNTPVFDIDIYTIGKYTVYIQKLFKKWMGRTIRMHTPLRTRSA